MTPFNFDEELGGTFAMDAPESARLDALDQVDEADDN